MFKPININCDLGEIDPSFDLERGIMPYISMCNVAIGGHAGDEHSIKEVFGIAKENNVAIGLHPSYPDKENFGRIKPNKSIKEIEYDLKNQLELGISVAQELGMNIHHIKAHGALYHSVAYDKHASQEYLSMVNILAPSCIIMGPPNCLLQNLCEKYSFKYLREGFADRAYLKNGRLCPRSKHGAVISDIDGILKQVVEMYNFKGVSTIEQETLDIEVESICLHSDTENSINLLKELHLRLKQMGIEVHKFS